MRCAIVLAAGASRRMGAPKMLLPLAGKSVIATVVDRLAAAAIDRIIVVAGAERARIAAALAGRQVAVVENPDPDAGMLSSVRCGLRALPPECRAVLVAPGDGPRISPAVVDAMLAALDAGPRGIVVPVHGGRRGHPIAFAIGHRDEVLSRYDGIGLRGLLAAHPEDILELPVDDPAVLADMDAPEDYRREREAAEGPPVDPPSH
jgi:molybdenum cofactor cytidylyltransferase